MEFSVQSFAKIPSFIFIIVLFTQYILLECYTPIKIEFPQDGSTLRIFSNDDIAQYDGSRPDEPLYMAVKGVVFDVTSGESFYGKDGPYNVLTGKDASRAVAKMSLEEKDMTSDLTGLSDSLLKALDDIYTGTYLKKYPIVGYMDYLLDETERRLFNDEL